jgi:predicted Zn-dependent protease
VLLEGKRAAEAADVYRAELARNPENGWSLTGLAQALRAQGSPEAAKVEERAKQALADADTAVPGSFF